MKIRYKLTIALLVIVLGGVGCVTALYFLLSNERTKEKTLDMLFNGFRYVQLFVGSIYEGFCYQIVPDSILSDVDLLVLGPAYLDSSRTENVYVMKEHITRINFVAKAMPSPFSSMCLGEYSIQAVLKNGSIINLGNMECGEDNFIYDLWNTNDGTYMISKNTETFFKSNSRKQVLRHIYFRKASEGRTWYKQNIDQISIYGGNKLPLQYKFYSIVKKASVPELKRMGCEIFEYNVNYKTQYMTYCNENARTLLEKNKIEMNDLDTTEADCWYLEKNR